MSVNNFIPTVWTATMLKERERKFVAIKNCNTDYEGDIKGKGDKVKINAIGDINISDYTKNNFSTGLTLQTLDDASTMLEITQSKYYNFAIDDVDKAQSNQKLMNEGMRKSGLALNNIADQFIFAKYVDAGSTVTATVTSANIVSTIASAIQKLYENDVPDGEFMVLEVSPQIATKLILAKIIRDYDSKTLVNGKIGTFLGADICMSNNVVQSGTLSHCMLRTKQAISYAEQLTETKAYTLTSEGFGDAVKGLMLYGAKTVKPKEIVRLDLTAGSESAI
jgi:hypothetical protein